MKVSVSLSEEDLAFLDSVTSAGTYPSRSAAVAAAIHFLRNRGLVDDYAAAYAEWAESEDSADWDGATGDGIG